MTIERVDEGNTIPFISGDRVSMEQFNAFKKEGGEKYEWSYMWAVYMPDANTDADTKHGLLHGN